MQVYKVELQSADGNMSSSFTCDENDISYPFFNMADI